MLELVDGVRCREDEDLGDPGGQRVDGSGGWDCGLRCGEEFTRFERGEANALALWLQGDCGESQVGVCTGIRGVCSCRRQIREWRQ